MADVRLADAGVSGPDRFRGKSWDAVMLSWAGAFLEHGHLASPPAAPPPSRFRGKPWDALMLIRDTATVRLLVLVAFDTLPHPFRGG